MSLKNAIIILNYNSKEETLNCLKILNQLPKNFTTIVVDNASFDNSIKAFKKVFPKQKIIENKDNLGFAAGNNAGVAYALQRGAERVLLLNSDTVFEGSDIVKLFKSSSDITGPILKFNRNGKIIYDLGGYINKIIGRAYHKERENIDAEGGGKPDYISGAAILIKRKVFKKIGYLDKDYFLYYEDSDFCNRARKEGFQIELNTKVIIGHKLSSIIGKHSFMGLYHNLRSNLLFIIKNVKWYFRPIALFYWSVLAFKVFISYVISSKIK